MNTSGNSRKTEFETEDWVYRAITVHSWDDARLLKSELYFRAAFRGQEKASWPLSTKLERIIEQHHGQPHYRRIAEWTILEEFQRRAHNYIANPPRWEEKSEWLAWIQHYGGPTRLLDFTYSFYVAAFFALESAAEEPVAIWAVNLDKLDWTISRKLDPDGSLGIDPRYWFAHAHRCNNAIGRGLQESPRNQIVVPIESERMNERASIQQGLFMFPLDIDASFEDNLAGTFDLSRDVFQESPIDYEPNTIRFSKGSILKVLLPNIQKEGLADLRKMNITAATLFPGLDGFARSLQYHCLF